LVSAEAGLIVANVASVLKVTTAPDTAPPEALFTSAVTIALEPLEMVVFEINSSMEAAMPVCELPATENPLVSVTSVVPALLVAVITAAPNAVKLAGLREALATPEALVSAVAGLILAIVSSVLKVTTSPAMATPKTSFNVAVTVTGALLETEVLLSVTVKLAAPELEPTTSNPFDPVTTLVST